MSFFFNLLASTLGSLGRGSFNPLSQGSPRLLWLATIKNHSCPAESARHQWDTGHFLYRVWTEFGPVVVRKTDQHPCCSQALFTKNLTLIWKDMFWQFWNRKFTACLRREGGLWFAQLRILIGLSEDHQLQQLEEFLNLSRLSS